MHYNKLKFLLVFLLVVHTVVAQELNARVTV